MSKRSLIGAGLLVALLALAGWLTSGIRSTSPGSSQSLSITDFLSTNPDQQFDPVIPGVALEFPEDHGSHPGFRQEWWYFTGNLQTPDKRQFGYQLTFFRFATNAHADLPSGDWNSDQTWMSHFVLSDIAAGNFIAEEEFARGGLGLAGAEPSPFRLWTNAWSVREISGSGPESFTLALEAESEQMAIKLKMDSDNPPVLHGNQGFSKKLEDGSVASFYYSYPDLTSSGTIEIDEEMFAVTGLSWMDREWSSAILGERQTGWDWFALHLDDGRKLMLFQLRELDENQENYQYALLIDPDSPNNNKRLEKLMFRPEAQWRSPVSGVSWPVRWSIRGDDLDITIDALQENQEVDLLFVYYEGAVSVRGTIGNETVAGKGYMELTGYGD